MKTYQQVVRDLRLVYPEGEARALARWLCEECFGLTQTDILLDKDNQLSADDIEIVKEITIRLIHHEPIQYILGHTDFCGHRICVGPGALIPRPETEQLVHHILATFSASPTSQASLRILDIGTGTGCIALSLALGLPEAAVTAWDISEEALAIAHKNVALYPDANVLLEQVDILAPPEDNRYWDIIVSNPPYVRQSESRTMEQNVLQYEPHTALFVPDDDPLRFSKAISQFALSHLAPEGMLWFEINEALYAETSHFIERNGFTDVRLHEDSFGKYRMLSCRKC